MKTKPKHICSSCFKELKQVLRPTEAEYTKYKGDKDLWEMYSHVAEIEAGHESEPIKIDAIYRYNGKISINFGHCSWNYLTLRNNILHKDKTKLLKLIKRKSCNQTQLQ